jgi:site-specific recombinase XerD
MLRIHGRPGGGGGVCGQRWGRVDLSLPFQVHAHMIRHATGYKLANAGKDTRSIQGYLGHKDIRHTVRYTELSPTGFKNFWPD